MNFKFADLNLALKKYIHVPKWEEEENALVEEEEKGEEAYHTFIKIGFILGGDLKWVKELFQKFWPNVGDIIGI